MNKSGRSIVLGGSIYIAVNFAAGLAYALNDGLNLQGSTGSRRITTISSSAIVAKVLFDLRRTVNPETEMILGIITFEDIFLAFYLIGNRPEWRYLGQGHSWFSRIGARLYPNFDHPGPAGYPVPGPCPTHLFK